MKIRTELKHPEGQPAWLDEYFDENNARHREGGPAIISDDGTKAWWLHGKMHRTDGPAIKAGDYLAWWEQGICKRIIFENGRIYEGTAELPVRHPGPDPEEVEAPGHPEDQLS